MAIASWAHICAYWASVAAIAGVFCPKMFVTIRLINKLRLATITGGGTVCANAASNAAAAARAWSAACSAAVAVVVIHITYGAAADAIQVAAGPYQDKAVSRAITAA
ncbi:hypothetical protein MPRG_63240 (plasmid) [Mycobacterium paragordonae]|uniref:Uncharacterized protein n=1 Tax=Mycobacterium paragordonae TaxID=1389713 RepID=A0ABQ1CF04_9MYCO|nr:hypothetical protein MPRG_63240 [Mycobacterium paragordonae]